MDQKLRNELLEEVVQTISALNKATCDVEGSGVWQTYEMFGGGLASKIFKRKKKTSAEVKLDDARRATQELAAHLMNITGDKVAFGTDWSFADMFLDMDSAEWLKQENLNAADVQLRSVLKKVKALKEALEAEEVE